MSEANILTLDLLAEGRISVSEAERLLKAFRFPIQQETLSNLVIDYFQRPELEVRDSNVDILNPF